MTSTPPNRYTDTERLDAIASGMMIFTQEAFANDEWKIIYFAEYFGVGRYYSNNIREAIDACLDAKGAKIN